MKITSTKMSKDLNRQRTSSMISMAQAAAMGLFCLAIWNAIPAGGSVLVPSYALPPASFVAQLRDQRSIASVLPDVDRAGRTVQLLVGGHLKHVDDNGNPAKNSFAYISKDEKRKKYVGTITQDKGVGWNQGQWDDGMLMSSAGEGKDGTKPKKEVDEDKKTLSDQVAEGKYALIQKEIFQKTPKRPGILSYETSADTRAKDNAQNLGGLKKDEIWLAEDHLLVLRGGSFPEHDDKPGEGAPWPPIDDYEAPRRQVKLPKKPFIPPPFPVRLSDNGPLVFLTPNGSVLASAVPAYGPTRGGDGAFPSSSFPFATGAPFFPAGADPGDFAPGQAPFPNSPFPYLPRNSSEGVALPPFPFPMNGSIPEGFPPGAVFLPPPGNQTDLYDEDDPSIYYPPPYNFSYRADNSKNNGVPAGPLVPGIVLPPPPDFFGPLEDKVTTTKKTIPIEVTTLPPKTTLKQNSASKRPTTAIHRGQNKPKTGSEFVRNNNAARDELTTQTPRPFSAQTEKETERVVVINQQSPTRTPYIPSTEKPRAASPNVIVEIPKRTQKPVAYPVSYFYDYPENYETNSVTPSPKPFVIYGPPQKTYTKYIKSQVTTTPIPLTAYYSDGQSSFTGYTKQNTQAPQPSISKQPENSLASFYFYDENPKTTISTPVTENFFDGKYYYSTSTDNIKQNKQYNQEGGFIPSTNVRYTPIAGADPSIIILPQKQGTRTLTQEYFNIQNPKVQQSLYTKPGGFFEQIADIQQTIDYFTTRKPKSSNYYQKPNQLYNQTPKPVYQFSFHSNQRPEKSQFRAPEMDSEPFRPMVSYSKPFNVQTEKATTAKPNHEQYLAEKVITTETPLSTKYYPANNQNDYEDTNEDKNQNVETKTGSMKRPAKLLPITATQDLNENERYTTPNPIDHAYYTKQDERLFDDITKNYFTIFGKKIEGNNQEVSGFGVTPSINAGIEGNTIRTPINNAINIQYASDDYSDIYSRRKPPPSLEHDLLVNYKQPPTYIEPDSEFVPIVNPQTQTQYQADQQFNVLQQQILNEQQYKDYRPRIRPPTSNTDYTGEQLDLLAPPSDVIPIGDDTGVNYKHPLPEINPDSELIDVTKINAVRNDLPRQTPRQQYKNYRLKSNKERNGKIHPKYTSEQLDLLGGSVNKGLPIRDNLSASYKPSGINSNSEFVDITRVNMAGEGRPGSFVSYRLPGDGAHVYFLTPQTVSDSNNRYQNYKVAYRSNSPSRHHLKRR